MTCSRFKVRTVPGLELESSNPVKCLERITTFLVNVTPGPGHEVDLAVLAPVLPLCAAALASGYSNINNSLAVSTWQGT